MQQFTTLVKFQIVIVWLEVFHHQDEAELVLRIVFQIQFRNLGFRDTNSNVPCSTSLKRAGEVGRFVLSTLEKRVRG